MRVALIITGLSVGGAEMMLLKLLERADRGRFEFHVFSLTSFGEVGPLIRGLGIPVEVLGMKAGRLNLRAVVSQRPLADAEHAPNRPLAGGPRYALGQDHQRL